MQEESTEEKCRKRAKALLNKQLPDSIFRNTPSPAVPAQNYFRLGLRISYRAVSTTAADFGVRVWHDDGKRNISAGAGHSFRDKR